MVLPMNGFWRLELLLSTLPLLSIAQHSDFPMSRFVKSIGNTGSWINSLDFSPDGSQVVSGDVSGNLTLWAVGGEPSTWEILTAVIHGPRSMIRSVDFSPDGSRVVSGDGRGDVNLWAVSGDPPTLELLKTVGNSKILITSVDFSPDGLQVVSGDDSGNLTLWAVGGDPSTWELLTTVNNGSGIGSVDFSPDGSRVVSGDDHGDLKLWAVGGDPSTWELLKIVGNSGSQIVSVSFSCDGSWVVSGDEKGNLNLWAVSGAPSTWQLLQTVGNSGSKIYSVDFSPDSSQVVSGDYSGNFYLWAVNGDPSTWQLLKTVGNSEYPITSVNFSPSGCWVVTGDLSGNVNMWALGGDPSSWELLKTLGNSSQDTVVNFSPDDSRVVSGDQKGNLNLWAVGGDDPSTWQLLKTVGNSGSEIYSVDFSPDGSQVVSGDGRGNLTLWAVGGDPSTWELLTTVNNGSQICSVHFSPDGSQVVSTDYNGRFNLWAVSGDPSTWKLLKTVRVGARINSVDFSPDGSGVVSGDAHGDLKLWAVSGDPSDWALPKIVGNSGSQIVSVSFSCDGSRVVSGDRKGNLNLWAVGGDPSTWKLLKTLSNKGVMISSVDFSPDGSRVVSADFDGEVNLWAFGGDESTWGLLKTVGNCGSPIISVSFSHDGSRVASGGSSPLLSVNYSSRAVSSGDLRLWAAAGSNYSTWRTSPLFAFLMVVNQYPTTLAQFRSVTLCGTELYAEGPYEVCNVTISQSSSGFMRRSSLPEVDHLLSKYLPGMRLNFTADLSTLATNDLPVSWRTISFLAKNTRLPSSGLDLFSFLIQSSPFVEEIDVSGTLVAGPLTTKPPLLRRLQAANTPITEASADFFLDSVELLDLRNTSLLQDSDAGVLNDDRLVFRYGAPSCSEPFRGFVTNGTLCKICHDEWYFDGRPSSQQCFPCLSGSGVAELKVLGAVLLGLVLLLVPAAYALRARIQQLRDSLRALRPCVQRVEMKGKLTIFAYQQLSQLGYLANPLPPRTAAFASAADIFNFNWLSNTAFSTCVLGLGYHTAWLLSLLEVALLLLSAIVVGRAFGVSPRESFTFAHSLTVMTIATKTLPLFDCDNRLVTTILPLMPSVMKPYLKVDYHIDCSGAGHRVFEWLGVLVLVVYCLLVPGLQTLSLFRARSVLNPPLLGQPTAVLTPEAYLTLARQQLSHLDRNELYPSRSLNHVQVLEVAAIRVRQGLLAKDQQFRKEVEMVSDYVPSRWWWFPIPTLSRVLLAGIYVCQPQDQFFLGCALCGALALGVIYFRPHLRQADNQHQMLCQASVALAFALNGVHPATPPWLAFAVGTLVCLPAMNLGYHLLQHFRPAHRNHYQLEELAAAIPAQEAEVDLPVRA